MDLSAVERYLESSDRMPYFLFVSSEGYEEARSRLAGMGSVREWTLSSQAGEDSLPLADQLVSSLKEGMADGRVLLVEGMGGYLSLLGKDGAGHILQKLKNFSCGAGGAILLLRDVFPLAAFLDGDPRMTQGERRLAVRRGEVGSVHLTLLPRMVQIAGALDGIRALLAAWERNGSGDYVVRTDLRFPAPLVSVRTAEDAYDVIRYRCPTLSVTREMGETADWDRLLKELAEAGSFEKLWRAKGFSEPLAADFHQQVARGGYETWLYFIVLKRKEDEASFSASYLGYVVENCARADALLGDFVRRISDIPVEDARFEAFYQERKRLLRDFDDSEMASFVAENRKEPPKRLYYLTDSTEVEREDIVAALSAENGYGYEDWKTCEPLLRQIYPALADYASDYVFPDGPIARELTQYFIAYKRQKLSNQLEPDFVSEVGRLAHERIYNRLPTRESLLEGVPRDKTVLFWVDALGVEYLSLIAACAERLDLRIETHIGRAMLPTITSVNRGFYDEWTGQKERKESRLDELKHKESSVYNYEQDRHPIHLAKEIAIIGEVMKRIDTLLRQGALRVVLTSDHGASRLAVLKEQTEMYEMDTAGQHSGRCCKRPAGYHDGDLPFAAQAGDYLVLADYGRFKGSRKADVEVHGGASLEEVVVPIIVIEKRTGQKARVSIVESEPPAIDRKTGLTATLFADRPVDTLSVVWKGERYAGTRQDRQHYRIAIHDIKKSGTYDIEVFEGEMSLGMVSITASTRGMTMNDDFF